jgi:protein-S-isoprenylcysteine O-methyltransferase Ste14
MTVTDFIAGFFAPWMIYGVILGLHLVLPARKVLGYVRDDANGKLLEYRLNGLLVLAVLVLLWAVVGGTGALAWDWLYTHRWPGLAGSCALGLLFSLTMFLSAPATGRSWVADLYFGRPKNPRFLEARVDAKMFLYLVGAAMLGLNLLSFTAHHFLMFGSDFSPGVLLYCVLFFWFVTEYLFFERVHLYTYDIFAERVGIKLGFGCFTFYPYFYAVGLWVVADLPDPGTPPWALVLFAIVFYAGWTLARGANMQKYHFKTDPDHVFLGLMRPEVLTDGTRSLLCSGFWGVSRHVNYLGEILMATGLTLVLGYPDRWVVWLYPLYYVALLFPRERADERRCAEKYGDLWAEYVRLVPRRIVPWFY